MASGRFHGAVGYNHGSIEQKPGVFVESIVERNYYGDIVRNTRQLRESGESINNDLTVGNSISILADAYAGEHFHAIRFVEWAGTLWDVEDVSVQGPRLILRLGGVYNGRRANNDEGAS